MGKYFIEECKCGVSHGGIACGPVEGSVNAAVRFTVGEETKWLTNSEFTGIPNFYITEESVFERFMGNDISEEFADYLKDKYVSEFDNIHLAGEYDEIITSLKENEENPSAALIRFVIALTRCDHDEVAELISKGTGHFVEEIDIPVSDVEENQK